MLPVPNLPVDPAYLGAEREQLTVFLDYQRGVMLRKVANLDDALLRTPGTPSDVTLLGMLEALPQALVLEVVTQVLTDCSVRLALQRSSALAG